MDKVKFTHYGWFGICPVLYADIESSAPVIEERNVLLKPLFLLSEALFSIYFSIRCHFDESYIPSWKLRVNGRLKEPIFK